MSKAESKAKLKKQIKELRVKNELIERELGSYKIFTNNLYKSSLINMNENKYTTAFYLVKSIQEIHHKHGAPFIYWSEK